MQTNNHELFKLTALRTGKDEQKYKDVGNYVFHALYKALRRPPSLIIKLKGVGKWYLRKKRLEYFLSQPKPDSSLTEKDFGYPLSYIEHCNRLELFEIFTERMKEYNEYIELRNKIRKERYKNQFPINGKDNNT